MFFIHFENWQDKMVLYSHPVVLAVLFLPALCENLVIQNVTDLIINERENENGRRTCVLGDKQQRQREKYCNKEYASIKEFKHENKKKKEQAIKWIKDCIVDYYCFKKHGANDEWIEQPSSKGLIEHPHFEQSALFSNFFFKIYSNWHNTKKQWANETTNLLYITAARYVYVTYLLYQESRPQDQKGKYVKGEKGRLVPSEVKMKPDKIHLDYFILPQYSCYPLPIGSATATSDYDVSLIGPKSGELVANFNDKFQEEFKVPSETVFDTNIYAYSLEYAIPSKIKGELLNLHRQNQIYDRK